MNIELECIESSSIHSWHISVFPQVFAIDFSAISAASSDISLALATFPCSMLVLQH
jgi:hypothetical protein